MLFTSAAACRLTASPDDLSGYTDADVLSWQLGRGRFVFSEREVHVRYMLSPVRLSPVCLSSVTLVHPTQPIVIFGNISTALGTLAIR